MFKALLAVGAAAGLLAVPGFLTWPVTGAVQWYCARLSGEGSWQLSVERARWVPWSDLRVKGFRLRTPHGGQMHIRELGITPRISSLLSGSLTTLWDLGEIRIDPGSWGIRREEAQAVIASLPVTTAGEAVVKIYPERVMVQNLSLDGPLLRLRAEGWFSKRLAAHLDLEGALAQPVLEGLRLVKTADGSEEVKQWQPFQVQLDGELTSPDIRFSSDFLSFSMKRREEPDS